VRAQARLVAVVIALLLGGCGSSDSPAPRTAAAPVPGATATAAAPAPTATATTAAGATACSPSAPVPPAKVPGAPLDTILRVPAGVRHQRVPLVLALHFASGTGALMEQATRLTPEGRRRGFAVAYPTASSDNFWAGAGEVGAVMKTLAAVQRVACIDPRRMYLVGISNGGGMASVLGCAQAKRFAAMVLFAPAVGDIGDCHPARPLPVLEIHGTSDPIVPYALGASFIRDWARLDGCGATPRSSTPKPKFERQRWPGCRAGAGVEHLRFTGGRHIELLPEMRAAGVDPANTAWRFLARYRAPAVS
jgi:polyhydroxybutyrate depolymerase